MNIFKLRCISIILIVAGYGWAGGHYIPSDSNTFAYLFQFVIIGVLMLLSLRFFSAVENNGNADKHGTNGLTIFSIVSLLINIANIIHGAINNGPRSFGSHNTFADLVPIAFLIIGSSLWIISTFLVKKTTYN